MNTVVILVLAALGAVILVGGVLAFFALRKAPDGFEDDEGFHHTEKSSREPEEGARRRH